MAPASVALLPCRAAHERDSMERRLAGKASISEGNSSADEPTLERLDETELDRDASLAKCRLPRRRGDESRAGTGRALHVSNADDSAGASDAADRRPLGSVAAAVTVGSRDRGGS